MSHEAVPDQVTGVGEAPELSLCVVVPAYNEEQNVLALAAELHNSLQREKITFGIVFVDDGSRDGTAAAIAGLARANPQIVGVMLSRNFGHQAAVSVGLRYARGRAVGVMDADLQDRPEDLVKLFRAWEQGADVAYAIRRSRREHILLRLAYRVYYRLLARLANIEIPVDSGDFCVMDASFAARLNELPERLRYVRGLRAWLGGRQVAVPVDRDARRAGRSQYSLLKLLKLAIDGFVSFSYMPLRVASIAGMAISLAAFTGMFVVLTWKLLGRLPQGAGVATIALSVLFLGGVQLITIGILGEYLGRVFDEVKGRPVAVVREVIGGSSRHGLSDLTSSAR